MSVYRKSRAESRAVQDSKTKIQSLGFGSLCAFLLGLGLLAPMSCRGLNRYQCCPKRSQKTMYTLLLF